MPAHGELVKETGRQGSVKEVEQVYRVTGAANGIDAMNAQGIPALGSPYSMSLSSMTVQDIQFDSMFDSKTEEYTVRVIYSGGSGGSSLEPTNLAIVNAHNGMTAQEVEVDLQGASVGDTYYWEPDGSKPATEGGLPVIDPAARSTWTVYVPTMEIEVRMPIGTVYNPALVTPLLGTCNSNAVRFGRWSAFNPDYVLFSGASSETQWNAAYGWYENVVYNFTAGKMALPSSSNIQIPNWNRYDIPMAFAPAARRCRYKDAQGRWVIQTKWVYIKRRYASTDWSQLFAGVHFANSSYQQGSGSI